MLEADSLLPPQTSVYARVANSGSRKKQSVVDYVVNTWPLLWRWSLTVEHLAHVEELISYTTFLAEETRRGDKTSDLFDNARLRDLLGDLREIDDSLSTWPTTAASITSTESVRLGCEQGYQGFRPRRSCSGTSSKRLSLSDTLKRFVRLQKLYVSGHHSKRAYILQLAAFHHALQAVRLFVCPLQRLIHTGKKRKLRRRATDMFLTANGDHSTSIRNVLKIMYKDFLFRFLL